MSNFKPQTQLRALLVAALIASGFLGVTTATIVTLNPAPANAAWTDFVPAIGGIYANFNGKQYFYGSYTSTGKPVFSDAYWEIMGADNNVLAHGRGETPGWVWGLVQKLFGF